MQNKRVVILSVLGIVLISLIAFFVIQSVYKTNTPATDQFSLLGTPQAVTEGTATPITQFTPIPEPGNSWRFVSMEEKVIYQNGYWYNVGTFENVIRPDIKIRAMCTAPLWPSPTPGTIYILNPYDILYPEVDNQTQNLQRFQVLK